MMSKIEKVCPVCGSNIALEEESIDGASAAEICPKSGAQWKSSESEENPDISRQDSALQEKKLAKNKKRRPSLIEYFVRSVIKKFADCSGRASRREFWGTQIYLTFFVQAIVFFLGIASLILPDLLYSLLFILCSLVFFIPDFSVCIRRIHDLNLRGTFYGALLILYFIFSCSYYMVERYMA